ncbi:conserved exported hypothetical protein [Gammaproteobacteria bacterium]
MRYRLAALLPLAILSFLYGCGAAPQNPGEKPGETPPRLVKNTEGKVAWDHPEYFGPVPAELKSKGDGICKSVGAREATGYHAKATDLNGKLLLAGGYFCGAK